MRIWIINPFDELPGDTDVRHRYWALSETLADIGHSVTWWSSNFSHRHKAYRPLGSKVLGRRSKENSKGDSILGPTTYDLRLIKTSPYHRNVSFARLRNHRQFARRFLAEARQLISAHPDQAPERIVVSLPPLGTADAALALRSFVNAKRSMGSPDCQVIVDIMDAWPETFYRVFPGSLRLCVKPLLFPLHRAARRAYTQADRISAVSQIYIDLAHSHAPDTPTYLCYHGIDLAKDRHQESALQRRSRSQPIATGPEGPTHGNDTFKLVYIGALERSYDLETAIRAVHELNKELRASVSPCLREIELHIAGAGSHESTLKKLAQSYDLRPTAYDPITFHGLLGKDGLKALLAKSHAGLIPMRQDSWVGLPYKLADYCAAGLPVISSLDGECRRLLDTNKAGLYFEPGSAESLKSVVRNYLQEPEKRKSHAHNARALAEELFDRSNTYPKLARFITET
jgi:glycosyltransferase involved in cell wall biosynthesis